MNLNRLEPSKFVWVDFGDSSKGMTVKFQASETSTLNLFAFL